MSWMNAIDIITTVFVPLGLATLLLFCCGWLALLFRHCRFKHFQGAGSLLFAFIVLGLTVGFSAANSRVPAIGTVLPALITLMSSVLVYSITKEALAQFRPVLPHCIILLSLASLFGLSIGSMHRSKFDEYERGLAKAKLRYEKVILEQEKAQLLADIEIYKQKKLAEIPKTNK